MKNQIYAFQEDGKYRAVLYSYDATPSGNIRPVLRLSSKAVFATASEAVQYLFSVLRPGVKENTEINE